MNRFPRKTTTLNHFEACIYEKNGPVAAFLRQSPRAGNNPSMKRVLGFSCIRCKLVVQLSIRPIQNAKDYVQL